MSDAFGSSSDSVSAQARRLVAVTPSDGADLAEYPKALYVAATGTVSIVPMGNAANTGFNLGTLPVGSIIPIRPRRVMATGTTATLFAMY